MSDLDAARLAWMHLWRARRSKHAVPHMLTGRIRLAPGGDFSPFGSINGGNCRNVLAEAH
jgi:hypothetical protein